MMLVRYDIVIENQWISTKKIGLQIFCHVLSDGN